jgi:hypothetical protein
MNNKLYISSILSVLLSLMYQNTIAQSWNITGNSNATTSSKLGTTNPIPLILFTNNLERMRIDTSGRIGIGTSSPNISALLDITSTTNGILVPRMTTAQRDAIASPAQGLLIFQTDGTKGFFFFDGSSWKPVTPSVSGFANRTLSNLTSPTAVNIDLSPGTTNARNLGSSSRNWKDLFLNGNVFKGPTRILNIDSAKQNTFLGINAGISVGFFSVGNTAVGPFALQHDSSGTFNTAMGVRALQNNTTGGFNSAFAEGALLKNNSGFANSAFGDLALSNNITGSDNSAFGYEALVNNIHGSRITAIGYDALASDTGGSDNTALGYQAGLGHSTSSTYVGTTASPTTSVTNAMALGFGARVTASNKVAIGNTSIVSIQGQVGFTTFSDGRFKKNIKENVPGLAFINKLRPITYTLDVAGIDNALDKDIHQSTISGSSMIKPEPSAEEMSGKQAKAKIIYTGFVAQEVEQAAKKLNYDFSGVDKPQNNNDFYGLRYGDFVVPLVKAVQELSKENDGLRNDVAQLKADNEDLKKELQDLKALVTNKTISNNSYVDLSGASLEQNTPNPFNSATIIRYHLPENAGSAKVMITDISGKMIKSIALTSTGNSQLTLSSGKLSAGTYNYTLWVEGKQVDSKKMIITK